MRNTRIIIFSFFIISALAGCKNDSVKHIDEGEIHYNLTYIGRVGTVSEAMLPNSMVVKFKNNKILMEIMTPIGNNGIFNIIDPEQEKVETFIRLLGMRFYYSGVYGEVPPGIDPMEDMVIVKTGKKKDVFGLECLNAVATIPSTGYTYDLWYTDKISIDNPNQSTPYKDIEGVLVSFFYRMGDMIVEFDADGLYKKTIPDKDFITDEKYRKINREDMDSIISKMMNL
ncbi:MAG: hypothetical protein R2744_02305 [Bacteroidales bacterium]